MAKNDFEWRQRLFPPLLNCNTPFSPNIALYHPTRLEDMKPEIKSLVQFAHFGNDKEGRPIYWEKTGVISANFAELKKHFTVDELLFFHVQSQELFEVRYKHASEVFKKPIHQSVVVFDLKDLNMSLDFGAISYMKSMLGIDQNYYPERLAKLFILNVPWFFSAIFSIFKPFIDQKTLSKFVLLGSDYMTTLEEFIDRSEIPVEVNCQCYFAVVYFQVFMCMLCVVCYFCVDGRGC